MKVLAYSIRVLLVLATIGALLLLAIAFLFNDTGESAHTLLAIWGVYPLLGLILIIVNEILLRKAYVNRSFRKIYGLFWACILGAGACAWAIYNYL
ncbi:hypothetical protein M3194_02110 [Paenibacillus glycanilyticus]|uniref:hypothetical protein n=1 Tax=Paenibacillus glycanilyticus TaxID=126569 RepID=UPI00203D2D49|nr:hypothetical protein [Paenibacillus glycanilyticus]MCM3626160.1 hypothetical protein [Paenibacillus glycanilyticus]